MLKGRQLNLLSPSSNVSWSQTTTPDLTLPLVIMMTGLIIVGLLIDLGGLPNKKPPIGFNVRLCASS
jgi:hypothetical protein